jgi:lipoprotein NlpD
MRVRNRVTGWKRERAAIALSALGAALLAGCASEPAPVEDRSLGGGAETTVAPVRAQVPAEGTYRVVRGDTLYSIAFRRGLDYRDVAAWNGITPPYKILVDQELRLAPPGSAASAVAARPAAATAAPIASVPSAPRSSANTTSSSGAVTTATAAAPASNASLFEDVPASQYAPPPAPVDSSTSAASASAPPKSSAGSARVVEASAAPVTANPPAPQTPEKNVAAPVVAAAPAAPSPAESAAPVAKPPVDSASPTPAMKPSDSASASVNGVSWRWPSAGKLVSGFVGGDQTKQGIDIAGSAGDPVRAAADGEVVYSGNGLIGYGELVIVKHNASFLSAYGHNRKRLVAEGDKVHAGQQIAEMGSSGAARDALHFEIRKNGKPVNPVEYLPAR